MTRMFRFTSGVVATTLILLAPPQAPAADWPHWRGPARNGTSPETGLPLTWGPDSNVAWKLPLPGAGGSTPIVWGERLSLQVADGERLELWAVDRSGALLWKRHLDDGNVSKRKGNLSSPSPVTDGRRTWVMTGTGKLKAFDYDGGELWSRDLQAEFGRFGILHGYSSSPVLLDGAVVVQVLHGFATDDPSYLLAVDQETGRTRWRVERPTDAPREAPDAYTTPALLPRGGAVEIVVSGADYVTGHDPASGRELWRVAGLNPTRNPMQRVVASPVVAGGRLFAPSRVRPLLVLEPAGGPAPAAPRLAWSTDRGPDVPTPAADGERLYVLTDLGVLWCLEAADGRVVWGPQRAHGGTYSASPVLADGRLYVTSEGGATTVVSAGSEFRVLAENDLGEYTLSSLAVAGGRIYQRSERHLWAIGR